MRLFNIFEEELYNDSKPMIEGEFFKGRAMLHNDLMAPQFEIRNALRDELYNVAEFLDNCWKSAYKDILAKEYLNSLSADERYKKLLNSFDNKTSEFLVLSVGNEIAGVTVFGKSTEEYYPDDGEISAIYLRTDIIGKGYGHKLFTKAEGILRANEYKTLLIDVFSANTSAIKFYKAHGYSKIAEKTIPLGGREYTYTIMRKTNIGLSNE